MSAKPSGRDDPCVPYEVSTLISNTIGLAILSSGAALVGWLAARLLLRASQPTD